VSIVAEERLQRDFTYEWASGILVPIMSVALAIIVGGIVVLSAGANPFSAYWQLFQGAFLTPYDMSETLVAAIPLMFAGLAVAFAFRAGMFNIGAEGQLFVGAIASAYVGYTLHLSGWLLIPLALIVAAGAGGIWAGVCGFLKASRGAHEVITTMMLNYVAILLSHYLLESTPTGQPGPMEQTLQAGNPETLPMNASLPVIIPSWLVTNGRLHAGLLIAIGAALLFWFILRRTTLGYKIQAVGLNQKAAAYSGIHVGWTLVISMFIAGAFAGLAGMVQVYGVAPYQLTDSFSPGYGFNAIAVALLGKNTASGTILAAILFGALEHGGAIMQTNAGISIHLVDILQGLIIFFIAAGTILRILANRGLVKLPRWQRREAPA
jgi:simple sugar transport system permease protein